MTDENGTSTDRPRLLLVETDREVLHVVPGFMERVGDVTVVRDLESAMEEIRRRCFRVAVVAHRLLDGKGPRLIRVLRQKQPHAQVMLFCEQDATEVPASLLAEGIGDVLVKPFDVARLPPRLERLLEVMEEQLRRAKLERDLEARVRHHDRVALLGTLVATVAHEVANPLSVVSTNATFVSEVLADAGRLDHDDVEAMRSASQDAVHATMVVKEYLARILKFARAEKTKRWGDDLADTLRTSLLFARSRAHDQGVRVHVSPLDEVPKVPHMNTPFAQAVVNALTNAIDAASPGGNVWLRTEHDESTVTVVVEDDGPGLGPEQQEKMLEAFYTTKESGTGLGTVVMHRVMHEHGGEVAWSNREGRGVSVRLALPLENPTGSRRARSERPRG